MSETTTVEVIQDGRAKGGHARASKLTPERRSEIASIAGKAKHSKIGRPCLPPEQKRTARLSIRTYSDIALKAALLGTEVIEKLIREATIKTTNT